MRDKERGSAGGAGGAGAEEDRGHRTQDSGRRTKTTTGETNLFALGNQLRTWRTDLAGLEIIHIYTNIFTVPVSARHFFSHLFLFFILVLTLEWIFVLFLYESWALIFFARGIRKRRDKGLLIYYARHKSKSTKQLD